MYGIMTEFILWSDNPETPINHISQSIDILPVEQEVIGDIKYYGEFKNLERIVDASSLMYSTGYIDTIEVEVALHKMINIIEPRLQKIEELVNQYNLNAKFCVVINLSQKPIIIIPSNFIQIMAKLSAKLEFDTYITKDNKNRIIKFFQWFNIKRKRKKNV